MSERTLLFMADVAAWTVGGSSGSTLGQEEEKGRLSVFTSFLQRSRSGVSDEEFEVSGVCWHFIPLLWKLERSQRVDGVNLSAKH